MEPAIVGTELETLKKFHKRVEQGSRSLYLKLLERGASGAGIDQLAFEMELEGMDLPIVKGAIGKLVKRKLITKLSPERYATTSSLKITGKTYEIMIEKIYSGSAVVMVDDTWRPRLIPADYHGPRKLIKKNSRFRALAKLYRVEGTLCIRVDHITEIL